MKEKIAVLYEKRDINGKRLGKVVNLGTANSNKEADAMYLHYKKTGKKLKPKTKKKKSTKRKAKKIKPMWPF